jgi:hypothetical protein
MPDISMCPSTKCDARFTCYRNEASGTKPCEYRQSFMLFGDEKCGDYWETREIKTKEEMSDE